MPETQQDRGEQQERIDPRYDPAFQRGYGGEVRSVVRGDAAPRRSALASPAPVRPAPAVASVPASVEPSPDDAEDDLGEPPAGPIAPAAPVIVAAAPAASLRDVTRNPFYLAAAALAVVLVVAGAVWLQQGFAAIDAGRYTSNSDFWSATTMAFGGPLCIGIGVAIAGALLFVLARAWQADERP